jgi:type IV secretion system effector X-Tfes-like protein
MMSADARYLEGNPEFLDMPSKIKSWIRSSPNATTDFADFLRRGGFIDERENVELPYFRETTPPRIVVDGAKWNVVRQQDALEYPQFRLFGVLAHEIGHDRYNTGTVPFTGSTADQYVQYRSALEAKAVFNAFPIFKDLTEHPEFKQGFPFDHIGYLQGMELGVMYHQWRTGELDDIAVVDRIAARVPETPYTLGGALQDQNTDGRLTHRDLYLQDYTQYVAPKLTPQVSRESPNSPAHPSHPDHALLEQIRAGVRKVDQEVGKPYDDMSERISRCLLAACKDHRDRYPAASDMPLPATALTRVDHVVLGSTGNIFAIQGKLDDPAHKRAFVSVEAAIRTPVEQSDEKVLAANQAIAQEGAWEQQQVLVRGINDPSLSGPSLMM